MAVTERRTRIDWALQIKQMLDERYPDAIKVRLVMDNLNTHSIVSLYETFEPKEARRLVERLDIHHTPKHGSWLNMAEIELSVLQGQCLDVELLKWQPCRPKWLHGKEAETTAPIKLIGDSLHRTLGSN